MAINFDISIGLIFFSVIVGLLFPAVNAQPFAPTPAPANDGTTIDQGIACVLMLLALVLTYIIH